MALEGNAAVGVDKSKQWYREVGTDKINQYVPALSRDTSAGLMGWLVFRETLQPATESLREHELFKRQIFGFLKGSHANERVRSTKESLQQQLEELDSSQLRDLASSGLVKADKVHSTYVNERKTGMKRAGRVTQNFFKVFSDFLAAYSGIVDLVKGAGQQYGEAAYEALSLFLIVRYKNLMLRWSVTDSGRLLSTRVTMIKRYQSFSLRWVIHSRIWKR